MTLIIATLFLVLTAAIALSFRTSRNFLHRHRRASYAFSAACLMFTACTLLSGCAEPTWLSDLSSLLPGIEGAVTGLATFFAGLFGGKSSDIPAQISTWIADAQALLTTINQLIADWQESPSATIESQIQAESANLKTLIGQITSYTGLSASAQKVVNQITALILSQLDAWLSLIPALSASVKPLADKEFVAVPAFTRPLDPKTWKRAINDIWNTPTGDVATDAALAKAHRL
jgi:hypothetical protein